MNLEGLANNWIEFTQLNSNSPAYDEMFWVLEEVDQLVTKDFDKGYQFILEVLCKSDDPMVQFNLAAGPLENLLLIITMNCVMKLKLMVLILIPS